MKNGRYVAIIEARMGSSRLPGKVLKTIVGKPMLQHMIERVRRCQYLGDIVVATSVNPRDDALEVLTKGLGVRCFRGDEQDVMKRVLDAAKANAADHIVEMWGDSPLMEPSLIDATVEYYRNHDYDCVGVRFDGKLPRGLGLLVFPTAVLAQAEFLTRDPVDRENVSNYIYEHPDKYRIGQLPCPPQLDRPHLHFTVDYPEDFDVMTKIFEHFSAQGNTFSIDDVVQFLDSRPELAAINPHMRQDMREAGMKEDILRFKLKGARKYVQGPDLYNAVMEFIVRHYGPCQGAFKMTMHSLVFKQCRIICSKSGEPEVQKPADAKAEFILETGDFRIKGYLQEMDEAITGRYEYDEAPLTAMCDVDKMQKRIVIRGRSPHTPIEVAVSMNKHLLNTLFLPDAKEKWYFTRLELERVLRPEDRDGLRLTLVQNLQNKLTKSRMFVGDEPVGSMYFSLVKQ